MKNVNCIVDLAEFETHRSEPAFSARFSTISAGERVVRPTRAPLRSFLVKSDWRGLSGMTCGSRLNDFDSSRFESKGAP